MPVVPPLPRYTVENPGDSIRITIPSRKNWLIILFFSFWLVGWAAGELTALSVFAVGLFGLVSQDVAQMPVVVPGLGGLFMLTWLGIWTAGGALAIYVFLWNLTGKEVVQVNRQSIAISRKIFALGQPKEYLAEHIKDLRVAPLTLSSWFGWSRAISFWGFGYGLIAFDYGARTFRFGGGTDEAEAKMILSEILRYYPQYGRRDAALPGA